MKNAARMPKAQIRTGFDDCRFTVLECIVDWAPEV
jgi:hypothetical protein